MLKVHLKSGKTLQFDLANEQQAAAWFEQARLHSFQSEITALTIHQNGVQYSLPCPRNLDPVFLYAEVVAPQPGRKIKGGERIIAHAGDVELTVMVHSGQRAARVDVTRLGKRTYNPITQ